MKIDKIPCINNQYVILSIMSIIFAFIVYRCVFIYRILGNFLSEKEGFIKRKGKGRVIKNKQGFAKNTQGNSTQQINSMISNTGKKLKIVQKRSKGQQEKVDDMNKTIVHINKELNKKMNG